MALAARSEYIAALKKKLVSRRPPEILYHYTSSDGLLGIISTKTIWATNIWFLNDFREFNLALDLAQRIVADKTKVAESKFALGVYEVIRSGLASLERADVFVSSFSEHGDQLSQWRGYCPPARGYSVGVTIRSLRRNADLVADSLLAKCIYSEQAQKDLIEQIVDDVLDFASSNANSWGHDRAYRESYKLFSSLLSFVAPMLKDSGFSEEAEWRLALLPSAFDGAKLEFRSGASTLVPYCRQTLADEDGHLTVREIIVGPTLQPDLAQRAVQGLLERHRATTTIVKSSPIPFRPW